MSTRVLRLATSALILACSFGAALAQDRLTPQPDQQQMQSRPAGQDSAGTTAQGGMRGPADMMGQGSMGQGGMMGPGGMMRHGMMDEHGGRGMMADHAGRGMVGGMGPPIMMRMMFALMDADGDGSISLQEFQAAHERIFKAMDANRDGVLTMDEIEAFMHGSR